MGKNKTQRTKGNTKPSSSGRTAELLSSRGVNSFLGFGTLSVDLPGFSTPTSKPENEDSEVSVDSEFRLVMKKATKRDSITKIKALQEFAQLCVEKDEAVVKKALPFWPRLYCKLAIDQDRKVREAAQYAHKQLVTKVKKNLAPYLKSVMGAWLISMCDPYAPSSSVSNQAFEITFPPAKQAEALEFCKEEIFVHIEDILYQQTIDTISDPKMSSRDERETQYLRLVAGCFNGLHFFLHTLNNSFRNLDGLFKKLVNNPKYWKYANHKDPEVKRSWYCAAQALCQFIPTIIEENAAKLCPLTLGSLNEDNPMVASTIWETSLHIMVTLKDCWQYVNVKNVILPKIFKVLKDGGKGNASTIFHNLLPILSKLPDASIQPETEFFREFFESFKEGMKLDSVRLSSSELNAMTKAFMECLQYCLLRKKNNPDEARAMLILLITEELVPMVKEAFLDNSCEAYSIFFHHLGCFLRYLELQSRGKNEEALFLAEGLKLFFSEISPILKQTLSKELDSYAAQLSKFVHCLHYGDERVSLKKGVRFAQADEERPVKATKPSRKSLKDATLAQETHSFCENVFQKLRASPSLPLLKLFSQIIISVPSEDLFSKLITESNNPSNGDKSVIFTQRALLPMLKSTDVLENETEYVKCVVSMVITVLSCTSEDSELETLNYLCKNDNLVLERLVQEASELRDNDLRLAKWLKGAYIGQSIVQFANGLASQLLTDETQGSETDLAWKLLQICFTTNREFDPFIAPEYINTILDSFTKSIKNIKPNVLHNKPEISFKIVKLLCDLAKNLFNQCQGCWDLPSAEALLLGLFQLSCKISDIDDTLFDILEETWFLGVKKIVESQGVDASSKGFLQQSVKTVKKILSKKWKYNEITEVEKLADKVEKLLKAYAEGLKNEDDLEYNFEKILCCILEILLPDREVWIELENSFISLCKLPRTLCVSSLLDLPLIEITLGSLENDLPAFLVLTLFTSRIMEISFNLKVELDDQIFDISLKNNEQYQFVSQIPSVAMGAAFGQNIYIDHQIPEDHKIRAIFREFRLILSTCVEKIRKSDILPILEDTLQRANKGSYPHAITLAVLFNNFVKVDPKIQDWLSKIIDGEQLLCLIKDKGTNVPHVIYCLMPYFNQSTVTELVKMATSMLLKDEQVSQDNDCWILGTLAVCLNSQNKEVVKGKEIAECALNVLRYFVDLWKIDPNILNPNWSKKYPSSLQKTTFVSQMSSIFIAVVKNYPEILDQDMWDTILCTLVGWITRSNELREEFPKEETTVIPSILTFKLLYEINSVLKECRNGRLDMQIMPNLLTEWDELYLENIYIQIIPLFLNLGENLKSCKVNLVLEKMLTSIGQSLLDLPADLILKSSKDTLPTDSDLLVNLDYLLQKLHPMLISSIRPLALGSHFLLFNLMKKIPEIEVEETLESEDEDKCRYPPKALVSTMESTSQILETLLSNFDVGDCCLIQPFTDSFTFAYGYMLSWIQMLELFSSSSSEVRSLYATYLRKSNLLEELLLNLFRLMPINPTLFETKTKTMFNEPYQFDFEAKASFHELQYISCHVYLNTLRKLPALVRQWWLNRDKRIADIVNKFTTSYVSNVISNREVKAVLESKVKFSNMIVKARPQAREVVAKYTMEDITIELVIKLPANHPLSPVEIETGKKIGVSSSQWRNWNLQLTTFLTHQNGSILDGVSLWKRNIDKRFEGVEECMICFYVLHSGSCELPRLTCKTCKKRFHNGCLLKWFNTSLNSSCPLCRNLF